MFENSKHQNLDKFIIKSKYGQSMISESPSLFIFLHLRQYRFDTMCSVGAIMQGTKLFQEGG